MRDLEQGRSRSPHTRSLRSLAAALGLDTADRERLLASRRARPNHRANLATHGLHVGILGRLSVRRGEQPVQLRAPLQRMLLGLLALQAGQTVPRGEVVEMLWGEDPPATHQMLLHSQVARLRRLLEPDRPAGAPAQALPRDGGGYRLSLALSGDHLDLARFDELVAAAERACAGGDPGLACDLLAKALGCWRGPLLADADQSGRLRRHPAAVAASQRRLAAAVALGDLANDLGRHQQAAAVLEPLAREEPLHEGLAARLVLALAGSGEQAAALRLFTEVRERLADELGIDPSDELRAAHLRVLRGGQLAQLAEPIAAGAPGAGLPRRPDTRGAAPSQLPPDVADFTGRAEKVEELRGHLTATPGSAVVVTAVGGAAGVGKTALALHVAHGLRGEFPDGQLYVNLRGAEAKVLEPAEALDGFLRALGVMPQIIPTGVEDRAGLYRDRLADRRMLVVLDNAADAAQVRPLLPGSPSCAVLVTSRFRLDGLAAAHRLDLTVLDDDEAVALLGRIAGQARVEAEPDAAGAIVAACGRLPLAVRIAGARLASRPHWPLTRMATRLADETRRLSELVAGDLAVRASFELSYRALPPSLRTAFRLLGLTEAPDFSAWALAALLDVPVANAEDRLEALVDVHLLEAIGLDTAGQLRYRFHDLIRVYARDRLLAEEPESGSDEALRRLMTATYTLTSNADKNLGALDPIIRVDCAPEPWAPSGEQATAMAPSKALAWVACERAGLLATTRQAHQRGWWELACALAGAATNSLAGQARWPEWEVSLELGLDAARRGRIIQAEATFLYGLAALATSRGEMRGLGHLLAAHRLFGRAGDRRGQAASLHLLGQYAWARGQHVAAEANIRHAVKIFSAYQDDDGLGTAYMYLGPILRYQGRFPDAEAALVRAGVLARRNEKPRLEWRVLRERAALARARGRYEDALALADRGLTALRALGEVAWEPTLVLLRGELLTVLGRSGEALEELEKALELSREGNHQLGVLYSNLAIAFALLEQRRLAEADRCLDEVERLMETDRRVTARYLLARGTWQRLRNRPHSAVDALLEARGRIHEDGAERHLEVEILYGLGLAYVDAANHGAALGVLREALTLGRKLGCALPAGLGDLVTNLTNRGGDLPNILPFSAAGGPFAL